jgi:hypothetical protein
MNRTPLRLVAIEESPMAEDEQSPTEDIGRSPSADDEQSGAPVAMMSEQSVITRRVPESEIIASMDTFRDKPKRPPNFKILLLAGSVAFVVTVVVVAVAMKGKRTVAPAPVNVVSVQVATPQESPPPQPQPPPAVPAAPSAASPPRIQAVPEFIRLEIAAEPMDTELSLDGNVMAGHRLNLEVPKDRGIHVVSASAPGYIPFNQQVSFSSNVVLKISLRRAHTPPGRPAAKLRPSQIEAGPKSNLKPVAASPGPGLAPGMNLDGPSTRPNAKPIDERNPYKP